MPLDKLVLIIFTVIAAAGGTIWLMTVLLASLQVPGAAVIIFPIVFMGLYVLYRVIAERTSNKEDDYYDNIKK